MNIDKPFVSIIVLNYNGKKWLKDCFESLERLNYPKDKYEVIMGDNASSDDSIEYVKKKFSFVRILQFDKNYGFCKGNNLCAKEAKGEYLVFLNNDTFVEKEWLAGLIKGVLSDEKVIACAPKIVYAFSLDNIPRINWAGGKITPDGGGTYIGIGDIDKRKYNIQTYTGYPAGTSLLIEKKFFLDSGKFEELYTAIGEEMDIGLRVWQQGYKVLYVPSAVVYHWGGAYSAYFSRKNISLIIRNKFYAILKNFEIKNIIKGLLLVFGYCFFIGAWGIITKRPYIIIDIIHAGIYLLTNHRKMIEVLQKRRIVQRNRKRSDKELYKIGVISSLKERLIEGKKMQTYFEHCSKNKSYYSKRE